MTVINYLLDHGADVNAQEYDLGNTSLHLALKVGSTELVKLYLEVCLNVRSKRIRSDFSFL
jgi:ankyrin repeat protein